MAPNLPIAYLFLVLRTTDAVRTFLLEEECKNGTMETVLSTTGLSSSATFASLETTPSIPRCNLSIRTEPSHGVIIVFHKIDLWKDLTMCRNFLQICEDTNTTTVCRGRQLCKLQGTRSMSFNVALRMRYVSAGIQKGSFLFTVTSYKAADHQQCGEAYLCDKRICIWKGFQCDKMNNCGDKSDETHCGMDWHLYMRIILAIFLGVVCILLFLVCFVYCYYRNTRRKNGVTYQFVTA